MRARTDDGPDQARLYHPTGNMRVRSGMGILGRGLYRVPRLSHSTCRYRYR